MTTFVPKGSGLPGLPDRKDVFWVRLSTPGFLDTSPAGANGFHDLYLVFTGGDGELLDVDHAAFSD